MVLRAATLGVHERLHVAPPFVALARGRLARPEYAALLSQLAGYYFSVAEHLPIEPERLEHLRQDLSAVDAPTLPDNRCAMPRCEREALGWRYVVEGSIFGGRVIYRQLDYLFGDEVCGRRFFLGTDAGVRRWQALCAELDNARTAPGALERMVEGALDAFAAFEAAITARGPAHA